MSKTIRVPSSRGQERLASALPDLQTQLEDLLNQVWMSEKEWTLDDRIALSQRVRRS